MPRIDNGSLILTRADISALARKIGEATGQPHSASIALIAQGLGFEAGNALMGALKNSEAGTHAITQTPPPAQLPARDLRGYRYDLRFSFVTDDLDPIEPDLAEIAWLCGEGPAVGGRMEMTATPLDRVGLAEHATRYGSTPDFFFGHEEDDEA